MDSEINSNQNQSKIKYENNISLNTISTNNSDIISSTKNNNIFKKLFELIKNRDIMKLKAKFFNIWKNAGKSENTLSLKIVKIQRKKLMFETPSKSSQKNNEKKSPIVPIKPINYNFIKRKIQKIKIIQKKKSSEIIYPKKNDDDIYNNIIKILNKIDISQRKNELLFTLSKIEDIEKNNYLKTYNSNNSIISEEEEKNVINSKNVQDYKNKIKDRVYKRIKNALEKNDIKQKYFNRWKKSTIFFSKSSKSIKRLNRINIVGKEKDLNLSDYDEKSYKTTGNMININVQNREQENELDKYILPLYKNGDKNKQKQIKNTLLEILKFFGNNKTELKAPTTPFNDSSFSYSIHDINTERSEEESLTNRSMLSISRRMHKKLKTIFEKKDVKMAYFNRWKKNVKLKKKRIILNKKDKENLMKRFLTSNIFSKSKKGEQPKNIINKSDEIIINKNAPLKDIVENNNIIRNLNDYLNNNTDFSELEEYTENDKANKDKKDNFKLETINNIIGDKMTPKNSRKMNHMRFNTDNKLDFNTSLEQLNKMKRFSATPGRYRLSFIKVPLSRSKTKNSYSYVKTPIKKTLILKRILKILKKKNLKKYFDIWNCNTNLENSDNESDNEEVLEIIKTNELKLENSNFKIETNKEVNFVEKINDIKGKNSCLNSIYGICYMEDSDNNKNKDECISLYGNNKSEKINDNIQPDFANFLKEMNSSIATFNLFNFYTQFHDNKFLIKKKFLPIWRNIK